MSAAKEILQNKRDKAARRRHKVKAEVSWKDIDNATLRSLIALAEHFNGAIRIGRSRDRAVYGIGFYIGEERFTEWIQGGPDASLEIEGLLNEIYQDFEPDSPDD